MEERLARQVAAAFLLCTLTFSANIRGANVRFAIIGDYGVDDSSERDVANLVATNFQPDFIVTVGDNNYIGGANIDEAMRNGFPYVVNGAGGAGIAGFGTPIAGSVVRYNADHGAMLVKATSTNITYEFWSVAGGGTLIDRFTQAMPMLSAARVSNTMVRVSWLTNGA